MNAAEFFSALTWLDGLDLFLLFVVFYGLLRLVRGTRAVPVLLSIGFFAVSGFLAQALELVAVAAVLKYFLEYAIIIIIVVFHQELRRILQQIGQRLLPQRRREAAHSAVAELVTAIDRLSKARIGALFILEGEIDVLASCSDAGRPVEADLHVDTLVALCVPHPVNEAHDGAIVIRGFRIERTAVICPLSDRSLDPRFGTRHRGAIGISQETDALVVVLSEERGEIRVVSAGEVSDALDPVGVERAISEWLDREREEPAASASRVDLSVTDVGEASASKSSTNARVGEVR